MLEFSLLKFIIELARDIGSSAFDVKPEFDSLIIFDPIPFKEAIIGLPQARYDWSFPELSLKIFLCPSMIQAEHLQKQKKQAYLQVDMNPKI